jgi:hypothetical protein
MMTDLLRQAISEHPMTCAILVLYTGNVGWYLAHRQWGLACYWLAAGQITIAATWLRGWGS